MFVIELKLQEHFNETFLNEERWIQFKLKDFTAFCGADLKHLLPSHLSVRRDY